MVWQVTVDGNDRIEASDVLQAAAKQGIHKYQWKFKLAKSEELSRAIQQELPGAAWVGVDIRGTHITIKVVEATIPDRGPLKNPRNIVAAKSALVTEIQSVKGRPMVKPNTYVRKGAVLISGTIGDERRSARARRRVGRAHRGRHRKSLSATAPHSCASIHPSPLTRTSTSQLRRCVAASSSPATASPARCARRGAPSATRRWSASTRSTGMFMYASSTFVFVSCPRRSSSFTTESATPVRSSAATAILIGGILVLEPMPELPEVEITARRLIARRRRRDGGVRARAGHGDDEDLRPAAGRARRPRDHGREAAPARCRSSSSATSRC